uniref:RNA-dependent RNA polymerase n=1 Tax=Reticulitermes chinensis sobeli-like virus 1 TaxID=3133519 RepID=A0AAT9JNT4_9VIRU
MATDLPRADHLEAMLVSLEDAFAPVRWNIPQDFMSYEHFERVVQDLDWTSSPGYPYLLNAPTNGSFFQVQNGVPSREAKHRVWQVLSQRLLDGSCDPIRLFIKPEPHKVSKLETGRYRLISAVSVVDQIIDSMLFGEMNQNMVEHCLEIPSKFGWSPYVGGWKVVPQKGLAIDKSSWDWTMQGWLFQVILELRSRLCLTMGEPLKEWQRLATWRYKCLFGHPEFILSNGLVLSQVHPGVMKSGCVNTIADNSIAQVVLHLRVCLEMGIPAGWIWTMGDDTLQESLPQEGEYLAHLSRYCIVKESTHKIEFAGHQFRVDSIEPSYFAKHCFNLLHADPLVVPDLAVSYALLYHKSKKRDFIHRVIRELGGIPASPRMIAQIYDGLW